MRRSTTTLIKGLAALCLLAAPAAGRAQGILIDDGPQHLDEISSIGESLRNAAQRPLHILYVHGIGATEAGDSLIFQESVCRYLRHCTPETVKRIKAMQSPQYGGAPVPRDYADGGEFANGAAPPAFEYMGRPVWTNAEEWSASAPFVDHYVLNRTDGVPIVVDEINWWPLVLPVKCQHLMAGEARLAGPYKTILKVCSAGEVKDAANPGRFRAYPWVSQLDAKEWEAIPPKGALFNRSLKNTIFDWGFSDAFMSVGAMHPLFREGMRQLFRQCARFNADGTRTHDWEQELKDPHGIDREFVVVAHSLGSYLVFSTLNLDQEEAPQPANDSPVIADSSKASEDAAARYIFERTTLVYFFANQIPLLELATMQPPGPGATAQLQGATQNPARATLSAQIRTWRNLRRSFGRRPSGEEESATRPRQVVAWSDPSDLLTWRIPEMKGLTIDNLYVRNTFWHWIIAGPVSAHVNYAKNPDVMRIMMGPRVAHPE
jgi:pimeloyl-ACP methyl ester carboxylesterase